MIEESFFLLLYRFYSSFLKRMLKILQSQKKWATLFMKHYMVKSSVCILVQRLDKIYEWKVRA